MNHSFLKTLFWVTLFITLNLAFFVMDSMALSDNLLVNGNAETGATTGWNNLGGSFTISAPHSGIWGFQHTGGIVEQEVDLSAYAAEISKGGFQIRVDGYVLGGGFMWVNIGHLPQIPIEPFDVRVWTQKTYTVEVPNNERSVTLRFQTAFVLFDDFSVKAFAPRFDYVSGSALNFGNLYKSDFSGATEYNQKQAKTLSFKNGGANPSKLIWSISSKPSEVDANVTSGLLSFNQQQSIKVTANPSNPGNYSPPFIINANSAGNQTVNLTATVYGVPTATHIAPALGANGRVNVARDASITFEVKSPDPLFPGATIKGYQWQAVRVPNQPDPNAWDPTTGTGAARKDFQFAESTEWTIYARMVDNNGVATTPVAIPVTVWNRPVVAGAPPPGSSAINSSWFTDKYVGVVSQAVKLHATSDTEPTLSEAGLTTDSKMGSGAGTFDGIDDHVSVTGYKGVTGTSPRTVVAWIKTSVDNAGGIVSWGDNGNGRKWTFRVQEPGGSTATAGAIRAEVSGGYKVGQTPVNDGQWHHVAVVLPDIANPNITDALLYVDGIEDGSSAQLATAVNTGAADDVRIGNDRSNRYFNGELDDVGIFNRALNQQEIAALANQPLSGRENGLVYYNSFDYQGISRYVWRDNQDNVLATQLPGKVVERTFSQQNLNGSLKVKAVTNHGIESTEETFNLKVYATLTVDAGGPYTSKPKKAVLLNGSINKEGYPSATFSYQWRVKTATDATTFTDLPAKSDPDNTYTWQTEGNYDAELVATVTTQEGLKLTGRKQTTVTLEAGLPTARPGGPYRGGIAGGNFSPIQLQGNLPNFVEDPDVGKIVEWKWSSSPKENGLMFDGVDDHVSVTGYKGVTGTSPRTVVAWIKTSVSNPNLSIVSWGANNLGQKWTFRVQRTNGTVGAIRVEVNGGFKVGQTPINDGQWHHIAVVLPDIANPNITDALLYVDGLEDGSSAQAARAINTGAARDVWIGTDFFNNIFNGAIDDVAIFDHALDPAEIQAIMENSPSGNEAGLVGYWPFEEGGGNTTADLSGKGNNGTLNGNPTWFGTAGQNDIFNATREYQAAGTYTIGLRVQSELGKWSPIRTTTTTVIDGKIEGTVKAADLRTPVKKVTIKLTSSHVAQSALARVAAADTKVQTSSDGGLTTTTDDKGKFNFARLPLGSYRLEASKGSGDDAHEFETKIKATELTLDGPNQLAIDFVDLSVFPIGGQVYYSIRKNGQKVPVENVSVIAQPAGSSGSDIESLPSTKSLDAKNQNYSLPLFSGKYLFLAKLGGHDLRLIGTQPSTGTAQGTPPLGYNESSQLLTIEAARTDIDFIDYTTRKVTVFVEDSGEFPIETFQGNPIEVSIIGENGAASGTVTMPDTKTLFEVELPPGVYTVSLPNVPTAIVKGDSSKKVAEIDVTGSDAETTMVVPVKIELAIGPAPKLLNVPDEFLSEFGLTPDDNPEGFMIYFPPEIQTHTYEIVATANGNRVEDFTLEASDQISQLSTSPAPTITYPNPAERRFEASTDDTGAFIGKYTIFAGLPNTTVVDEANPDTYVEDTLEDGTVVKVPKVLPKTITFRARKDGYEESDLTSLSVTILGDLAEGSVSQIISVPNVNYLVLHDPPGDGSVSTFEDTQAIKGTVSGVSMNLKDGREIPVYPSPWSAERSIGDVDFDAIKEGSHDLGRRGLLGYRDSSDTRVAFYASAGIETGTGIAAALTGPVALAIQTIKLAVVPNILATDAIVQYEVSPSRSLTTPAENEINDLPDLMGPGKGDLYYGEGWTMGLQTKHRLGIKMEGGAWVPDTQLIVTYDILERENQYVYTIRDIENIIGELDVQISALGTPADGTNEKQELDKLTRARDTWQNLLNNNPAYVWRKEHIVGDQPDDRETLESFLESNFPGQEGELLIFTGGSVLEYSRTIVESNVVEYGTSIGVGTSGSISSELENAIGFKLFGSGTVVNFNFGGSFDVASGVEFSKGFESGTESEQTVGFVLSDSDIGDSYTTYVYEGPWGTPIFFTDPGSISSAPWQAGTQKGVDVQLELISEENNGPFDYRDGAHYTFRITSTGVRKLEGAGHSFLFYDLPLTNTRNATIAFNGHGPPYSAELFKGFGSDYLSGEIQGGDDITAPSARVTVTVNPPQKDWGNSAEVEYPVLVQAEYVLDYQIAVNKMLRPRFADLRAPRAFVTSPYDGQRVSPVLFTDAPFEIKAFSDDPDVARIQVQLRTKQPDGVFEPWQNLSGVVWEEGGVNDSVTVVTHTDRDPPRKEFTFNWEEAAIRSLGVGEYQLQAVAQDAATRLAADGETQTPAPNIDLDPPPVTFLVDDSKPTVLTSVPFYQDRESKRIYRGELSVTFTDDMKADDFSDRTFEVTDLLDNGNRVAGFVSYSPALRKTVFVPVVPFVPNGFYRAVVKTDTFNDDGSIESRGVRDLAGNPLDNEFSWTFRTTDAPFEETWSITLSATDGTTTDANNIAALAFGAEEGEDEKDARAVPRLSSQIGLSFVDKSKVDFDRDTRPADGRLGHHWFFVVANATNGATVTLNWKPSLKLTRTTRQYQVTQLVEFDAAGNVANTIQLNPVGVDPEVGAAAHTFTATDQPRFFRLDVMKANMVATAFAKGSSGWKFFSAPITPQRDDPFVNLGDDIEPFQMFKYVASQNTYKIYPLDIGEVGLQAGHGYFTRLAKDVEVDVGGTSNNSDLTLTLDAAGWHAVGNPFILPVNVADVKVNNKAFAQAVTDGDIEGTLHRWKVDASATDAYEAVISGGQLASWEGYFLKTLKADVTLTIPAPAGLANTIAPLPPSFNPPLAPPAVVVPVAEGLKAGEFDLRFALTADFAADLTTQLGIRESAKIGADRFDMSEPPTLKGTASIYFEHLDWDARAGQYNTDYRPALEVGETSTWEMVVFSDQPDAVMQLSWSDAIQQMPNDMMFEFRPLGETEWQDMRQVRMVEIDESAFQTKVRYEIRATRIALDPIADLSVIAGEAEVKFQWSASDNLFIDSYQIYRNGEPQYEVSRTEHTFTDTNVAEETTYTYQVSVRFKTGAELKSELLSVTVLPVIKATVLLQSYPNPFNPETWIPYELAKDADVTIDIYNINGQLVRTLPLGHQIRGRYISREKAAYWDGRNHIGEKAASGIYFYLMRAGTFSQTRKMVIVK